MKMTDTQLLILNAAGDSKAGVTLAHIATKVTVANPKRACEALVKRGLIAATEIKLTNGIGKAAGYALTNAGEESLGYLDDLNAPPPPAKGPDAKAFIKKQVKRSKVKTEAKPRAEASGKPEKAPKKTAPKEGTRTRGIFDILTRNGGATNAECKAANLGDVSLKHHATRMAERFGLTVKRVKEDRGERVSLV